MTTFDHPRRFALGLYLVLGAVTLAAGRPCLAHPEGIERSATPAVVSRAVPARVILFSGKKSEIQSNWIQRGSNRPAHWKLEKNYMISVDSDIYSRQKFTDFLLHVEFRVPYMPWAHGQERGNSGVYLQGRYEIQVLDSYPVKDPGTGDCGAVYGQAAPLVKAYRPPMTWQTYDILFRAPREDASTHLVKEPARVSIFLNGIPIQNNQEIRGPTGGPLDTDVFAPGPVLLQFHGNTVAYRNIWVMPLPETAATHY